MPIPVFGDLVQETFSTIGPGTISLTLGAVAGFQTFSAVLANAGTCYYLATDGTHWEVGLGTFATGSPPTLARTSILSSTNSNAAVYWTTGTKNIWLILYDVGQMLYPEHFGASTSAVDNHAALQSWLSAGGLAGMPLGIAQGTYSFQSGLSLSSVTGLSIQGAGKTQSVLQYTGSNASTDILAIGSSSADSVGLSLKGFGITSTTAMASTTLYAALHLKYVTYSDIDVAIGTQSNANCYHGLWADFSGYLNLHSSEFYVGSGDAVRANDRIELHMNHSIIVGTQGGGTGNYIGTGLHIGGNYGGVYTEQCSEIGYGIGIYIDNAISTSGTGNSEIFIGPDSAFDTNGTAGIYFADTLKSPGSVKRAYIDGWFETAGYETLAGGNCLVVTGWNNGVGNPIGIITSSVGKFGNASGPVPNGNGMVLDDTHVRYVFGPTVSIQDNFNYGILSGNTPYVIGTPDFFNNDGGGTGLDFANVIMVSYPITGTLPGSPPGDVDLTNILNYFDGPSVSQPSGAGSGTWFVNGTVTMIDTAGAASYEAKLWDGSKVIASTAVTCGSAGWVATISLSGTITNPSGNLRISVRDTSSTSGKIKYNATGYSVDSIITAI